MRRSRARSRGDSPSTSGFPVGTRVRMYCKNGVLFSLSRVDGPPTTSTATDHDHHHDAPTRHRSTRASAARSRRSAARRSPVNRTSGDGPLVARVHDRPRLAVDLRVRGRQQRAHVLQGRRAVHPPARGRAPRGHDDDRDHHDHDHDATAATRGQQSTATSRYSRSTRPPGATCARRLPIPSRRGCHRPLHDLAVRRARRAARLLLLRATRTRPAPRPRSASARSSAARRSSIASGIGGDDRRRCSPSRGPGRRSRSPRAPTSAPRVLFRTLARWGVELVEYDQTGPPPADADIVWVESPANPVLTVPDWEALRAHPGLIVCDATVSTPVYLRALDEGADVVVHSATKFLTGSHSALLGATVTRDPERTAGAAVDPHADRVPPRPPTRRPGCSKGLDSLTRRMRRITETATELATAARRAPCGRARPLPRASRG